MNDLGSLSRAVRERVLADARDYLQWWRDESVAGICENCFSGRTAVNSQSECLWCHVDALAYWEGREGCTSEALVDRVLWDEDEDEDDPFRLPRLITEAVSLWFAAVREAVGRRPQNEDQARRLGLLAYGDEDERDR